MNSCHLGDHPLESWPFLFKLRNLGFFENLPNIDLFLTKSWTKNRSLKKWIKNTFDAKTNIFLKQHLYEMLSKNRTTLLHTLCCIHIFMLNVLVSNWKHEREHQSGSSGIIFGTKKSVCGSMEKQSQLQSSPYRGLQTSTPCRFGQTSSRGSVVSPSNENRVLF